MRTIAVEEAFGIIQRVYGAYGWKPDSRSSREQRNEWLASAVACVHYGHPQFNAAGGDPRWCIKSAGGGRPQSDDVIVYSPTRAYWDIIGSAGADNWGWSLSGHGEPLPAEQQVYPPSQSSLPGGAAPPVTEPPPVTQPPPIVVVPPHDDHAAQFALLNDKLDAILAGQAAAEDQQAADTAQIGTWMVEQAQGVVAAIVGQLEPKIDAIRCRFRFGGLGVSDVSGLPGDAED